MQLFPDEAAARYLDDRIVMVLDGAGWHQSQERVPPANLRLLKLPPYSPELNPVEHLWDELREKSFHNLVFDSLDALEGHLEFTLREMEKDSSNHKLPAIQQCIRLPVRCRPAQYLTDIAEP